MFGFFKRKPKPLPPGWRAFALRFMGSMAMATALAKVVNKHAGGIKAGEIAYPAHKEVGAPIIRIWHSLRLESCIEAVRFGEGVLVDLADIGTQQQILAAFVENRAHLLFPQPSGSRFDQSVQAMWQVYHHLSEVGSEVCDSLTDRHTLRAKGKDIISDIEGDAVILRAEWQAFLDGEERKANVPRTLFDIFLADLNRKTKSIALSTYFGPEPDKAIPSFLEKVKAVQGGEFASKYEAQLNIIRAADNPDQAAERLDDLR